MSNLLIIALLIGLSTAALGETRLVLGGWSKHVPASDSVTNERHDIVGIEYNSYSAGRFDNSYDRETYYIARNWRWTIITHWNGVASLGINRGYRTCWGDDNSNANFCPHGYLALEYDKYRIVPTIKLIPGVVVFSPEIKF